MNSAKCAMSSSVISRASDATASPIRSRASDLRNGCSPPRARRRTGPPLPGDPGEHGWGCPARRCAACSAAPQRMPPSSSPPPARPGPPCTRCGTGEPWPVLDLRVVARRARARGRGRARCRRTSAATALGSAPAIVATSEPPPRFGQPDRRRARRRSRSAEATGPNASISWTASASASSNRSRIGAEERAVAARDVPSVHTSGSRQTIRPPPPRPARPRSSRTSSSWLEAGQRPHRDPLVARVAEHDRACIEARRQSRRRPRRPRSRGHDHAPDARALLAGLRRDLV